MPLTKKAMVLFEEKQYKKLETYAKSHHISVGQVIREAVEATVLRKGNAEERLKAAARLTSAQEDVGDWIEFEKEIAKGHIG